MRRAVAGLVLMMAVPGTAMAATDAAISDPGERAFQYCFSCHSVDPSEDGLPGPNLFGVIGRPIASKEGFRYSKALREFAKGKGAWTAELIEKFIQNPGALAPGTQMEPPPGVDKAETRKLVIEYLRKQK